jgi:exodeoxyribonuclease V beta subunit
VFEQYLCLKASAGTGKTFSLVVRYISLIFLDENINDILCVTFTNKATNEMEQRIISVMQTLEQKDEYLEEISKNTTLSIEEIIAKKDEVYQKLLQSDIHILTIDKFLNKILRSFCWYKGINQDFEINNLDEELLKEIFLNNLSKEQYNNLIGLTIKENLVLNDIFHLFNVLYQKDYEIDINSTTSIQDNIEEILKSAFEIKDYVLNSDGSKSAKNAVDFDDIDSLMKKGEKWLSNDNFGEYKFFKKIYNEHVNNIFLELKENIKIHYQYKENEFLTKFIEFYKIFKKSKNEYIKYHNQLDFNDVTTFTYDLLNNKVESEFLQYRLDSNITHLLIDEFQDTNLIQYQIFSKILEEVFSGIGQYEKIKTLFYVGDPKQSIYRFRGGNSLLFDFVYEQYKDYGLVIKNLDTNYRSRKNIVAFVNDIFKNLYDDYVIQKDNTSKNQSDGFIQVYLDDDILTNIKESVITLLDNGYSYNDITILAFKNDDINKIANYLQDEFEDIELSIESKTLLINQPKIKAIINLIKYIYFEQNIYKSNFLSLIGVDIFKPLDIEKYVNLTEDLQKLIYTIVEDFSLNDKNTLKFINKSFQYKDIIEFIFSIDLLDEKIVSSVQDGIKIMTIHKSKGLQFDNLIVADNFTKPKTNKDKILFDYDKIYLNKIFYKQKNRENFDEKYELALQKEEILNNIDIKNTIYVALTRAVENLFIIRKNSFSSFDNIVKYSTTIGQIRQKTKQKQKSIDIKPIDIELKNYGKQTQFVRKTKEERFSSIQDINFGTAVHYTIENLELFKLDTLKNALISTQNKFGHLLEKDGINSIEKIIKNLISNEEFKNLIKDGKITKELQLAFNNQLNIIDLLIEKEDEIIIIDYKTSNANKVDKYREKMSIYKDAISTIFNKKTSTYLVFMSIKELLIQEV